MNMNKIDKVSEGYLKCLNKLNNIINLHNFHLMTMELLS